MAEFRFSRGAEADLLSIGAYTLRTWGEDQTIRYIDDLEACCQTLADNPTLGRACDEVRPGLRRMECGQHVVFYREDAEVFWCPASSISACCPKDTPSTIETRDLRAL